MIGRCFDSNCIERTVGSLGCFKIDAGSETPKRIDRLLQVFGRPGRLKVRMSTTQFEMCSRTTITITQYFKDRGAPAEMLCSLGPVSALHKELAQQSLRFA